MRKPRITVLRNSSDLDSSYMQVFPANQKCYELEDRFYNITDPGSKHYGKGMVIYSNGVPVGVSKFIAQSTMVPFKTDYGLEELAVYDLPIQLDAKLRRISGKHFVNAKTFLKRNFTGEWIRVNVEGALAVGMSKERHTQPSPGYLYLDYADDGTDPLAGAERIGGRVMSDGDIGTFRRNMEEILSKSEGKRPDLTVSMIYGDLIEQFSSFAQQPSAAPYKMYAT